MDLIERKKAIDIVNAYKRQIDPYPRVVESLEKLPSAQPEPCKDAVSREAAIDAALSAFSRGLLASPDIRKLPSAQPEIIHCRDCKHSMNNENGEPWICNHPNNNAWRITPDHYCGYAERRTDESNDIT